MSNPGIQRPNRVSPSRPTGSPSAWLLPANLVTELRLLLVPLLVFLLWRHRPVAAMACFLLAAFSDAADGWLARRRSEVSRLGLVLDPLADKLLLTTLFISLALLGDFPLRLTLLALVRDLSIIVVALILFLSTGFSDFHPSRLGKLTTFSEMVAAAATLLVLSRPEPWMNFPVQLLWLLAWLLVYASGSHYALLCSRRYHAWRIRAGVTAA